MNKSFKDLRKLVVVILRPYLNRKHFFDYKIMLESVSRRYIFFIEYFIWTFLFFWCCVWTLRSIQERNSLWFPLLYFLLLFPALVFYFPFLYFAGKINWWPFKFVGRHYRHIHIHARMNGGCRSITIPQFIHLVIYRTNG